jgi:pimeloyl-ACP methyl ester carboxylesterase
MDDIAAVLDATGSRRAALIEVASASMLTAIFAATYPERTQALVIYEPRARGSATADYPWSSIPEQTRRYQEAIKNGWGWVRHAREHGQHHARAEPRGRRGVRRMARDVAAAQRSSAGRAGPGHHGLRNRRPACPAGHRCAHAGAESPGQLGWFDGPARAVRCAQEIVRSLRSMGLGVPGSTPESAKRRTGRPPAFLSSSPRE